MVWQQAFSAVLRLVTAVLLAWHSICVAQLLDSSVSWCCIRPCCAMVFVTVLQHAVEHIVWAAVLKQLAIAMLDQQLYALD